MAVTKLSITDQIKGISAGGTAAAGDMFVVTNSAGAIAKATGLYYDTTYKYFSVTAIENQAAPSYGLYSYINCGATGVGIADERAAILAQAYISSNPLYATQIGVIGSIAQATGGNVVSNSIGLLARHSVTSASTTTNRYGLYIEDATGTGTVTNQYGIYIPALTKGGTLNYAIYSAGTATSYFGGSIETSIGAGNTLGLGIYGTAVQPVRIDVTNGNSLDCTITMKVSQTIATIGTTSNTPLSIITNNAEKVRILGTGEVGIGIAAPIGKLHLSAGGTNYDPSLTYHATAAWSLESASVELTGGVATGSPYAYWLQTRYSGSTSWPLSINPLGGNVGIGTTAPLTTLHAGSAIGNTAPATYSGVVLIESGQTDAAVNGLEFKSSAAGSGHGYRLATVYDGASNIDCYIQKRANSASWTNALTIKGAGNSVVIGTATTADTSASYGTGNTTLGVVGVSDYSVISITGSKADADNAIIGNLDFSSTTDTSASDRRHAVIQATTSGTTANNRGGALKFYTKANNGNLAANLTISSDGNVTAKGKYATARTDVATLSNGRNDNVALPAGGLMNASGPTAAWQIGGIVAPAEDGTMLTIFNASGQTMSVNYNDANSTAANRILNYSGGALSVGNWGNIQLQYWAGAWFVINKFG